MEKKQANEQLAKEAPKREPNRKERRAFVSIQRKVKKNGKKK